MQSRSRNGVGFTVVQALPPMRAPSGLRLIAQYGLCVVFVAAGCGDGGVVSKKKADGAGGGLKVKTTDQIGEFDPEKAQQVVDSKVVITNPITGPLEAYEPLRTGAKTNVGSFWRIN